MNIKDKNKIKTIEILTYWIIFFLFLVANIWYFRGFHKTVFLMLCILCIVKTLRYIVVKKWKKWHILHAIVSGFFVYAMIQFTCEMDIYFFPSTELKYYEETIYLYNITEERKYGIFPKTIPTEATDIEYYYTTEGYLKARDNLHAYLKITVSQEYLDKLLEKYKDNITYKLDCSIINEQNADDYLPAYHLDEYIEEFYGLENCTLYFMSNEAKGFIINWDKKIVKLFFDRRFK